MGLGREDVFGVTEGDLGREVKSEIFGDKFNQIIFGDQEFN